MSGRLGGIFRRFWSSEILKAAKEKFGKPKTLLIHHVAAYFDGGGVTTSIPRLVVSSPE